MINTTMSFVGQNVKPRMPNGRYKMTTAQRVTFNEAKAKMLEARIERKRLDERNLEFAKFVLMMAERTK